MDHDEPIILESRNVKFKSILFNAILTHTRIHLTPDMNNVIPSQDIPLVTIRNVETGENALRDHFLILSVITDAGEKHQAVLTFARQAGVERKRECNEWVKKIKSLIQPPAPVISRPDVPEEQKESLAKREIPTPAQGTTAGKHPAKKKIEITHPLRTGIEIRIVTPEPVETIPTPSGNVCSRCGKSVPLKSTFCNHCGTPIQHLSGSGQETQPPLTNIQESVPTPPPKTPAANVKESVPTPPPKTPAADVKESVPTPPPKPPAADVKESVPTPPPKSPAANVKESERENRGIPPVIHPIEPLTKDSIPYARQHPDPVQRDVPSSTVSQAGSSPQIVWPASSPPRMIPEPEGKKPHYVTIVILIMAILPFLVGLVIVANIISGPTVGPVNTTPQIPNATSLLNQSTPQAIIPSGGVWVRVSYAGTYRGLIGTPANQTEVNDTGDHLYPIPAGENAVAAALQKNDNSANQIILEVYKNGMLLKRETSIAPKAIVEIQLDVKT